MNASQNPPALVPQRWVRPLDFPPGHWKKQLASVHLKVAAKGDMPALRQLLAERPDFLNKRGPHNRTLLWEAVRAGKLEAVAWLVEQGADVNATGCYNGETQVQITPYCAAIYYRRPEVVRYLLKQKPQLDIFRAAFLGDQKRVAGELSADPALLQAEDPQDAIYFMPLLAFPVAGGHAELIDFLLRRGAPVAQYSAGLLALAARVGGIHLLEPLVEHGADVRAVDANVFVTAADRETLHYLLDHGAPVTQRGANGFPPLVYVARGDKGESPDKVRLLLERGAPVDAPGPDGRTALHYAAAAGHTQVMAVLLGHGAGLALKDQRGDTPLSLARARGKTDAIALLLQAGADR